MAKGSVSLEEDGVLKGDKKCLPRGRLGCRRETGDIGRENWTLVKGLMLEH